MNKETGKKIVARLLDLSEQANQLTEISIGMEKPEEAVQLRKSLAVVMVEIDEMLRQVLRQHPDLDPDKER
jgi:hypothetical protein